MILDRLPYAIQCTHCDGLTCKEVLAAQASRMARSAGVVPAHGEPPSLMAVQASAPKACEPSNFELGTLNFEL